MAKAKVISRTLPPDTLDLKFLGELEEHRGYLILMDWVTRQRKRWQAQLETCTPEELPGIQGAIRALRLVEGGREHCIKALTHELAQKGGTEKK